MATKDVKLTICDGCGQPLFSKTLRIKCDVCKNDYCITCADILMGAGLLVSVDGVVKTRTGICSVCMKKAGTIQMAEEGLAYLTKRIAELCEEDAACTTAKS